MRQSHKTYTYRGQTVKINRSIEVLQSNVNGRGMPPKPLVDNEGEWVQVHIEDGPNAGCRVPASKRSLIIKK